MSDFMPWRQQLHALTARHRGADEPVRQARQVLLAAGDRLYQLPGGRHEPLPDLDPETLAGAAARLLRDDIGTERPAHPLRRALPGPVRPGLLLLLPPGHFVATTVTLPGVAPEAVPAALELQVSTLLPGCEEPLALAVRPGRDRDALSEVALWFPERQLDALFTAFREAGLFLAGVAPRTVAAAVDRDEAWLLDEDARGHTRVHWKNGAVRDWQHISHRDLRQPVFREQWQTLREAVPPEQCLALSADATPYQRPLSGPRDVPRDYCLHPAGARAAIRQAHRRRRQAMAGLGLAAAMLVAAVPFLLQTVQMVQLESRLSGARAAAASARQDQAEVRAFENEWGILTEFPEQQVERVLTGLQEVIRPNVLGRLELEEGYVNIEGQSEDPQRLLQELEEHALFTEVDFASATSNNRYSIDLRLTTVDFSAYYDWYFPESNR